MHLNFTIQITFNLTIKNHSLEILFIHPEKFKNTIGFKV